MKLSISWKFNDPNLYDNQTVAEKSRGEIEKIKLLMIHEAG